MAAQSFLSFDILILSLELPVTIAAALEKETSAMESTRTLTKTGGITETGLKWIALVTMVMDHIHYFF